MISDEAIFHWYHDNASNHRDANGRLTFTSGYTPEKEAVVLRELNDRKSNETPCNSERDFEDFNSDTYQSQSAYCKLQ